MYKEIEGDLIDLAFKGDFQVVAHGVNCLCTMGAGIAPKMAKAFGCDTFEKEQRRYIGDSNKLGTIDFKASYLEDNKWVKYQENDDFWKYNSSLWVINAYTQYDYGIKNGEIPLDYEALTLCLRKINRMFKGKKIGLPAIGCGLAGGDWNKVKLIIQKELVNMDVTVVIYKKEEHNDSNN